MVKISANPIEIEPINPMSINESGVTHNTTEIDPLINN